MLTTEGETRSAKSEKVSGPLKLKDCNVEQINKKKMTGIILISNFI
jgi:hypothetical protein